MLNQTFETPGTIFSKERFIVIGIIWFINSHVDIFAGQLIILPVSFFKKRKSINYFLTHKLLFLIYLYEIEMHECHLNINSSIGRMDTCNRMAILYAMPGPIRAKKRVLNVARRDIQKSIPSCSDKIIF